MTRTTTALTMWTGVALMALLGGCTADTGAGRVRLGECFDGVRPGAECDAADDVECARDGVICWCEAGHIRCEDDGAAGGACADFSREDCLRDPDAACVEDSGRACRCERSDDGDVFVRCDDPSPPSPTDEACTFEHIDRCLAGEPNECRREDGRVCGCYPTDRGAEIFCVGGPPSVPECTDEDFAACFAGESRECRYDGRVCGCYLNDHGDVVIRCEGAGDPTDPDTCTDEHEARCEAGEEVSCRRDGAACWCDRAEDGTWLRCEATPPPVAGCTEEHFARCEAGEYVECTDGDQRCYCALDGDDADPRGGMVCDPVDPVPGHFCSEEHARTCREGGDVECASADGGRCICGPGGELSCESMPPGSTECTDEHELRCREGGDVECTRDGVACRCDADGGLRCDSPPPPPGGDFCTDEHYRACELGLEVRCASEDGTECRCEGDGDRGRLVCG